MAASRSRNVEFHQATIDKLPLPDASVDCVISNCVINLAPDKQAVFREIVRVLKPGGRLAVSDIALKKPLPPEIGNDLMAYVGCIAGAILIEEYRNGLIEAGFAHVDIIDTGADLNAYAKVENQSGCCSPPMGRRCRWLRKLLLLPAPSGDAGPAPAIGGSPPPLQRQRICGQCPCLRREAGLSVGITGPNEPRIMKVLFLCTGNSCRSQMAEGWARKLKSDSIEPYSAGIETHGLNPVPSK